MLPRLAGCADGRGVVVEDGRVTGVLSPSDVARTVQLHDLGALDPYAGGGGRTPGVQDPVTRS